MRKALISIFFIIVLMITASAVYFLVDEPLNQDAKNFLSEIEAPKQSASFVYLLGMFAAENENPETVGAKQLEQFKQAEQNKNDLIINYPNENKLALPKGDLFCNVRKDHCIRSLFSSNTDFNALFDENSTLIKRTNHFLSATEYATLTKPTLDEQPPSFQYLTKGIRLNLLKAIAVYQDGQVDESISLLTNHITSLRTAFAQQDTIIGKIIFIIKISDAIDVYSVVLKETGRKAEKLANLSAKEKDFSQTAAREFGPNYYLFRDLKKQEENFTTQNIVSNWGLRILYKPNMTINESTGYYIRLKNLSKLTPIQFAEQINSNSHYPTEHTNHRNLMGNIFLNIPYNLERHVGQLMDLEVKLSLFNQVYAEQKDLTRVMNPYGYNDSPKVSNGYACFNGPLKDERKLRCIIE